MEINISKQPKNVTLIEGFPGFGLVGTIATEYLLNHLEVEHIGRYWFEEMPPTIAIHQEELVDPVGIFYNKKNNLVIVHSILGATGIEWGAAKMISTIAQKLSAKEIISLEGVGTTNPTEKNGKVFVFSSQEKIKTKLKKVGYDTLKEGIIVGVTGALMLKAKLPLACFFAEIHSNLPNSRAAALLVGALDKYLNLGVDYKPLLKQAEKFEEKLKQLIDTSMKAETEAEKKKLSYVG